MIIECPKCHSKFKLQANIIGLEGRLLQCGICGHKWHKSVTAEEIEADINAVNEADETKEEKNSDKVNEIDNANEKIDEDSDEKIVNYHFSDDLEEDVDKDDTSLFIDKKFIASSFFVFLLLTALFAFLFPSTVIRYFPEAYPVYQALNIETTKFSYTPLVVKYRKDYYGNVILYVELKIKNLTDIPQMTEPIKIDLYEEGGKLLKEWALPSREKPVDANGEMIIKFGLPSPPMGGKNIIIRRDIEKIYNFAVEDKIDDKKDVDDVSNTENQHDKAH